MTLNELQKKLESMNTKSLRKLILDFGGGHSFDDDNTIRACIVRDFVRDQRHERRLCQLLDMPTEDEKRVSALQSSAGSNRISTICTVLTVPISMFAVAISFFALGDHNLISGIASRLDAHSAHLDNAADQVTEDTDALSSGGEPGSEQDRDTDGGQTDADEDDQASQTDQSDQPGDE